MTTGLRMTQIVVMELATDMVAKRNALVHRCRGGDNGADMAVPTTPTQLIVVELATDTVGKQNDFGNGADLAMVTTPLVVMELATDMVAKRNVLVHLCGRGDNRADLAVPTTSTQLVVEELATDTVRKQTWL